MEKMQIFFIELPTSNKFKFICDITELFYNLNHSVAIYANDPKNITQIDQLLWTWKQDSFIPHSRFSEHEATPVTLYASGEKLVDVKVLIQFDPLDLEDLAPFTYVIDFAEMYDKTRLNDSRKRYKQLRDTGNYTIEFMKLGTLLNKQL